MGGDVIPIPLIRLPCREAKGKRSHASLWWLCCLRCLHHDEFALSKKVVIKSSAYGCANLVLTAIALVFMIYYATVIEKGYLEDAFVTGISRVTLQHPVQSCNPLHAGCKANFTAISDIHYCHDGESHEGVSGRVHIGCRYFDEYEILKFDNGLDLDKILIPTRVSTFTHETKSECLDPQQPCISPYKITAESHDFVADIEEYTLLIDHSFSTDHHSLKGSSRKNIGFYRECPHEDCKIRNVVRSEMCEESTPECPVDDDLLRRTNDEYEAVGPGSIVSHPFGDVIKVKTLFEMVGMNLDKDNPEGQPWREEGKVVIIDINYMNYNEGHFPNRLPPAYEYVIHTTPQDKFKLTNVETLGTGRRLVKDVHGIHIITRVRGLDLGVFSATKTFLTFVEFAAVLGVVHWILHCVALNLEWGPKGDHFAEEVAEEPYRPNCKGSDGGSSEDDIESDASGSDARQREPYVALQQVGVIRPTNTPLR